MMPMCATFGGLGPRRRISSAQKLSDNTTVAMRLLRIAARGPALWRTIHVPLRARSFCAASDGYNWRDPLNLESKLTEEEIMIRDTAKAYCQVLVFLFLLAHARGAS